MSRMSTADLRRRRRPSLLLRGATLSYLGVMVVLPLVALGLRGGRAGASARSGRRSPNPFAWHALKLTFATALVMVAINAVTGHGDGLGPGPLRRSPARGS